MNRISVSDRVPCRSCVTKVVSRSEVSSSATQGLTFVAPCPPHRLEDPNGGSHTLFLTRAGLHYDVSSSSLHLPDLQNPCLQYIFTRGGKILIEHLAVLIVPSTGKFGQGAL